MTGAIVAAAMLCGASIAVPLSMLRAAATESSPQQAESQQPIGSDANSTASEKIEKARDSATAEPTTLVAAEMLPKGKKARELYRLWSENSRTDGKVPGALIGRLGVMVEYFISLNKADDAGTDLATRFQKLLPRFDKTKDWTPEDAVRLLDDTSAIHEIPIGNTLDQAKQRVIRTGQPLPVQLRDAPWGKPAANGLRAAWLLEPRSDRYRLGDLCKSRILLHNSGSQPIVIRIPSWQQSSRHTAQTKGGKALEVSSTFWTTRATLQIYRLAPGAFCETPAAGIGIGPRGATEDWRNARPGAWVQTAAGDDVQFMPANVEVRFSPSVVGTRIIQGRPDNVEPKNAAAMWESLVEERIAREAPLPENAADREQLLRRVVGDLFGESPTDAEIKAYVDDQSPATKHPLASLELLKTRVLHRRSLSPFTGTLAPGEVHFRVLEAIPDAARQPRVATGPGYYTLADSQRLQIERSTRRDDEPWDTATLRFFGKDAKHKPYEFSLPPSRGVYAIAWDRDAGVVWVAQHGRARKIDFTNPSKVVSSVYTKLDQLPERFRKPLQGAFESTPPQREGLGFQRLELSPLLLSRMQWGPTQRGLRAALIRPSALGRRGEREAIDLYFVVHNASDKPIRFSTAFAKGKNPRLRVKSRDGRTLMGLFAEEPVRGDVTLTANQAIGFRLFKERFAGASMVANKSLVFAANLEVDDAPDDAWRGELVAAEMVAAVIGHGLLPSNPDARELFQFWNAGARADGSVPGALIGLLANDVRVFIKSNPTWETTPELKAILPQFDATRDWKGAEALQLLERLAAVQTTPLAAAVERERQRVVRVGKPLPKTLAKAPWGATDENGLRAAWLLDPQQDRYALGSKLKSRILVHNAGRKTVVFRARNWRQTSEHTAHDHENSPIETSAIRWTTRSQLLTFRLAPGRFVELAAAGIGIGRRQPGGGNAAQVGVWLKAAEGAQVTFVPASVALFDKGRGESSTEEAAWWNDYVAARMQREQPLPADPEIRQRLLYDVAMDLFGTPRGEQVAADFLADESPQTLASLAKHFSRDSVVVPFSGSLTSGPSKFLVAAPAKEREKPDDAEQAAGPTGSRKGPIRSANRSGRYRLSKERQLFVCRPTTSPPWLTIVWPEGELWPESRVRIAPRVRKENYRNWAVVWGAEKEHLWFVDDTCVTHVDISNPAEVLTTKLENGRDPLGRFKLPSAVEDEFKRLGFRISRAAPAKPKLEVSDGQAMATAESVQQWQVRGVVKNAAGAPLGDVLVRLRSALHPTIDIATTKTDADGEYQLKFRLDLRTLARYRGVFVEPVLPGYTERNHKQNGLFDALLHRGEQPQKRIVRDYPPMWLVGMIAGENEPGPIRRFGQHPLILGQTATADFVMAPASTIRGRIVDADGRPLGTHYVWASAPKGVRPRGYETIARTQSDASGYFSLTEIPADEPIAIASSSVAKPREHYTAPSIDLGAAGTHIVRLVAKTTRPGSRLLEVERTAQP